MTIGAVPATSGITSTTVIKLYLLNVPQYLLELGRVGIKPIAWWITKYACALVPVAHDIKLCMNGPD
jgi:hypothetical protein